MEVTPPPQPPPKCKVAKNFNHKMIQVLLKLAFWTKKSYFYVIFPYHNWRVPLSPSTDNHSFKQSLAKLWNTATPSVYNGKTTQFSKKWIYVIFGHRIITTFFQFCLCSGFYHLDHSSRGHGLSICVGTRTQASVCMPSNRHVRCTVVYFWANYYFDNYETEKQNLIEIKTILPDKKGYDLSE